MSSMITRLTLSSEPGWGTAFRINGAVQVYQQSLFWLLCKGMPYKKADLELDYFIGSDVISCQFSTLALTRLLDLMQVNYFVDDAQIRWLLPHNVSIIFYAQWKNRVVSEITPELSHTSGEFCFS